MILSSTENRKKYDEYGENWQMRSSMSNRKNSNTTMVDNKLISVASVVRIIQIFESMFGGRSARGGGRRTAI
jgi:curved DNA-binding protein